MNVEKLSKYDFTILIDKSGSMAAKLPNGKTRWDAAHEGTFGLAAKVETWDDDGLTIYTFASSFKRYDNVTSAKVEDIWRENEPNGGTNLDGVLHDVFTQYLARKKAGATKSGEVCIIITDGEPTDQSAVAKEIIAFTKKLDSHDEFRIEILQIGDDPAAHKFLEFLDENLEKLGAKFDIVNTTPASEAENMTYVDLLTKAFEES